jgi:type IV pilus assembly protein PilX
MSAPRAIKKQGQYGMALVMVMLVLVAITSITLWMVKQSTLSEGMARNQLDQEAARQAAESALRDAERDIMAPTMVARDNASCSRQTDEINPNDFSATCNAGLCAKEDSSYGLTDWAKASERNTTVAEPWWPTNKGGLWNDVPSSKPGRVPVNSNNCTGFTGGVPLGTYTGVAPITGVAQQPEYLIEIFRRKHVRMNLDETRVTSSGENANQWSYMYRVTARGFGYSQRTQVVLQTIYFP